MEEKEKKGSKKREKRKSAQSRRVGQNEPGNEKMTKTRRERGVS